MFLNQDQKFLRMASLLCDQKELEKNFGKEWAAKRKELYEGFCLMYNSYKDRVQTPEIREALYSKQPVTIDSFDDLGIITVYNNLVVTGINQDDPSTWTPQFEWMVNYRLYKKASKILSSYINGSVGRESVYVVDKNKLRSGEHCVERKRPYDSNIRDDESYVLAAKWSPNTAETGRWKSAMHTIPWGSQVKRYYSSRFKGGTCLAGDTNVYLLSGERLTIRELAERGNDGEYVLSYDLVKDEIIPVFAKNFRETRRVSRLIEVELSDGTIIKSTPDHLFYDKLDCKWVRAENLSVGNSLLSIKFSEDKDGYFKVRRESEVFSSYQEAEEFSRNYNLMVVRVQSIDVVDEPVYCCTVDETHNFILSCGLVSHNCLAPDYSQMEVRTLSAISKDENMLELFHSGKDFHTQTAAAIWGKPPEEITPAERRYSKTATFSLLYGSAVSSFAKNYCNGDMAMAEKIYGGFFKAYPRVQEWVEERHKEVQRDHRVSLELSGRFINIEPQGDGPGELASMLRKSQNYPIQSFHYNTKVRGLDGKDHLIGDLAKHKKDLWVLSYNIKDNKILPVKGIQAQCTGTTNTWYKLTLDNGESIKVTPDHLMMLRDGTYKRADELVEGQSLMPLYTSNTSDKFRLGYTQIINEGLYNQETLLHLLVHNTTYDYIDNSAGHVHHIDLDITNNDPSNLIRLSNSKHCEYHRRLYEYCVNKDESLLQDLTSDLCSIVRSIYNEKDSCILVNSITDFHNKIRTTDVSDLAYKSMTSHNKRREHDYPEWYENQREAVSNEVNSRYHNHKVVKTERIDLDKPEPKYDLHIPYYNNFALSAGVFTHNSQSADLTGCVIFDLQKYIEDHGMKSLVFQYVHDSIEVDVYPYEFIQLVDKLKVLLNESPMRRMGLPSKADVTLGKSLGHELEMKDITYNEDYTDCIITLEGFKDEVYDTIENWKDAYKTVEIIEEEWSDKFISFSELFIVKKAFTPTVGTMRHEGKCKVHINYYI